MARAMSPWPKMILGRMFIVPPGIGMIGTPVVTARAAAVRAVPSPPTTMTAEGLSLNALSKALSSSSGETDRISKVASGEAALSASSLKRALLPALLLITTT